MDVWFIEIYKGQIWIRGFLLLKFGFDPLLCAAVRTYMTTNLDEEYGDVGLAGAGSQVHDDVVILGFLQQLQLD